MAERRAPKSFTLTLDEDLAAIVEQTRLEEGMESSSAAVRHMLRVASAATPRDGVLHSVKARVYEELKRWALGRFSMKLAEIQNELKDITIT